MVRQGVPRRNGMVIGRAVGGCMLGAPRSRSVHAAVSGPEGDCAFATRLARFGTWKPVAREGFTYDCTARSVNHWCDPSGGPTVGTVTVDRRDFLAPRARARDRRRAAGARRIALAGSVIVRYAQRRVDSPRLKRNSRWPRPAPTEAKGQREPAARDGTFAGPLIPVRGRRPPPCQAVDSAGCPRRRLRPFPSDLSRR
jgi:hypothetical protein